VVARFEGGGVKVDGGSVTVLRLGEEDNSGALRARGRGGGMLQDRG
jgi:hypothetical protein